MEEFDMTITIESLRNRIYTCNDPFTLKQSSTIGKHKSYSTDRARVELTQEPDPITRGIKIKATKNVNGKAVFLPYRQNMITSVRLEPPSERLNLFYTANMSGCKFFVDRMVDGSNHLIVYHSNYMNGTTGGQDNAPNHQAPDVVRELDRMAGRAQREHATRKIKNYIAFGKKDYLQRMNGLVQSRRLQAQENTLKYTLGTTIFGFPKGTTWEFYYQTWGRFTEETQPQSNTPTPPIRIRRRRGLFSSLCDQDDLPVPPALQVQANTNPFRVFYSARIG
jgi:hypothetical protein